MEEIDTRHKTMDHTISYSHFTVLNSRTVFNTPVLEVPTGGRVSWEQEGQVTPSLYRETLRFTAGNVQIHSFPDLRRQQPSLPKAAAWILSNEYIFNEIQNPAGLIDWEQLLLNTD